MLKKNVIVIYFLIFTVADSLAQHSSFIEKPSSVKEAKMKWWREARFGMFIHFGVYAQFAGRYRGIEQHAADGAWLFNRMKVPVKEYKDTAFNFNPINFNAEHWVKIAKNAGMKYIVVTAKHHDGFALFESKVSNWNSKDATRYKKDLIAPLAKACRKYGIKFGVYYSQEQDWGNPGGGAHRRPMRQGWPNPDSIRIDNYSAIHKGHWDPVQDLQSFDNYFENVAVPQVKELLTNYGDISILWWDTPGIITDDQAEKMVNLLAIQPNIISNDRLKKGGRFTGDYRTPEQKIPNLSELDGMDWENCMTMNNTWGYRTNDNNWKSTHELVRNLIDIASKGGNYLLNVGPKPDGSFPKQSVERLEELGVWMKKNSEAIYGTRASPIEDVTWGRVTAKDKKNKTTLYLSVFDWPTDGVLKIYGLNQKVTKVRLIGGNVRLKIDQSQTNRLEITGLPSIPPDSIASVIELNFDTIIPKKVFRSTQKMTVGALD